MTAPTLDVASCVRCGRETAGRWHGVVVCSPACRDQVNNPNRGRPIVPAAVLWERIPSGLRDRDQLDSTSRAETRRRPVAAGKLGAARVDAKVAELQATPGEWQVVVASGWSVSAARAYRVRGCELSGRRLDGPGRKKYEVSARWPS